ncbi:MAG TPA: alpha-L-arabinofuranosidase C-terminal domain-containing protein [Puia sp.]|uniref:alpha-L-arabinofuranosidase C-terminal domain-containing protein n=1 Tax=Puia sp. TaxID=2045100 RepID=UPI002D05068D|nr:alpha-L-arabinofuranosidase C-terminal domain-containing protein [Puia sp.]HVU94284.1 alpha-L-arabinofuranosidase C-terminal domain-containing protein [Puia sp.]
MKRTILACFFITTISTVGLAQTATIKIDVDRVISEIDPRIYGVFMEPIHFNGRRMGLPDSVEFNTLYGNLYDPKSPLADGNGFRKDYIEAMRELKITNMRWPGGNFLMGYDWKDGIGPKDQRPTRINLAWGGPETNHVGTDEWMALNKAIGSENIVCVNLGLGSILDAAYWVEYCNYNKGSYYSDLRAKNGHRDPYNVKLWDLGNEVDGLPWELGHKNAEDYVETAREAAKAMRSVDPTIKFVASGSSYYEPTNKWFDWNRKVLEGIGDKIDYLSIHRYWEGGSPDNYYNYMGNGAMDFDEKISLVAAQIREARTKMGFKNSICLSVDEWGAFARSFMSVLPIAQCLNSFIRHADVVKMANFTMLTSLLSSDPRNGTFKSPVFHTFKLFSNNCLGSSVDAFVACDTFGTDKYRAIPYLDVTAVYTRSSGTLYINVINRHQSKAIPADIITTAGEFSGKAEASIINSDDLKAPFSYDKRSQYGPVQEPVKFNGNKGQYAFPPHSFTQIKLTINTSK